MKKKSWTLELLEAADDLERRRRNRQSRKVVATIMYRKVTVCLSK